MTATRPQTEAMDIQHIAAEEIAEEDVHDAARNDSDDCCDSPASRPVVGCDGDDDEEIELGAPRHAPDPAPGLASPGALTWVALPQLAATTYCGIVLILGVQVAILGPALLSLSVQLQTDLATVAYSASVRTVAGMLASFGGPLYDRCNGHLLLGVAAIVGGIGSACTAIATTPGQLYVCMTAVGAASGFIDNGANVLMLWQFASPKLASVGRPWLQTLHFCFALGATAAPLLLQAFKHAGGAESSAFLTAGIGAAACGAWLCCLPAPAHPGAPAASKTPRSARDVEQQPLTHSHAAGKEATPIHAVSLPSPGCVTVNVHTWLVVLNAALVFLLYVGAEHSYGTFITSFCVLRLGMGEGAGQLMTALYWGSITIGRFISVFASMRFTPQQMLSVAMVASALSSLGFLVISTPIAFWILTCVFGLAMAPQFPTTISLAQHSFLALRAQHTTVWSIANGCGAWLLPFIVATSLSTGESGITAMMYVVFAGCALNACVYLLLLRNGHALAARTGFKEQSVAGAGH